MAGTITPGLVGEASTVVVEEQTARYLGSGSVAGLGTPALVALMERAAVAAVADHLAEGESTVGAGIDVKHLAPTPVGMTVIANATLKEIDGRRLVFDVSASDEVEQIGEGTHKRFIVAHERFEQRVREKQAD